MLRILDSGENQCPEENYEDLHVLSIAKRQIEGCEGKIAEELESPKETMSPSGLRWNEKPRQRSEKQMTCHDADYADFEEEMQERSELSKEAADEFKARAWELTKVDRIVDEKQQSSAGRRKYWVEKRTKVGPGKSPE
jgi:hydroxylamine reductase (hybrid-cluster protein)